MKQYISRLSIRSNDKWFNLFFTFLAFFLLASLFVFPLQEGNCAQVTLTWDPNSEPDLAGYDIYYGTASGNYQFNIDVGNVSNYTLTGLDLGMTYYAVATAYNTSGFESGFSNEVSFNTAGCTYSISPSSASFSTSGGSGSVNITTQAGCNWGTSASIPWITVTSGSGMGSGTMSYSVSANTGVTRSASMTIAGNVFTVSEAGLSTYTITATAGAGGAISPSGQVSVLAGAGQTFTITPNTGYQISNVIVDGVSRGAITSYTFSSVSANHTISASFTLISSTTYTLSVSNNGTGNGGVSINPSGTSFAAGTQVTLAAAPDANSTFSGWSGGCSGTTPTCQVTMNSNLSVTATFAAVIKTPVVNTGSVAAVTLNSGTLNGTVNPNGLSTTYVFEWGTTDLYGNTTTVQSVGNGTNSVAATTDLTGLTENALYHYRLVATNSDGTTNGADVTFVAQLTNKVDFNNDGKPDILWRNKVTGGVIVWYMNGATVISGATISRGTPLEWEIVGTGDFNNDGKPDILWRNKVTGGVIVWYMNGSTVISGATISRGVPLEWEIVGTGDLNNDGKPDILWRNKVTGGVIVWYMNGSTVISGATISRGVPLEWEIVGTGDFNNDGKPDILWRNKVIGDVVVWYMNGSTVINGATISRGIPLEWKIAGVGDFNGDGKPDILWRNKVTGGVIVWCMNGSTIISGTSISQGVPIDWEIAGL